MQKFAPTNRYETLHSALITSMQSVNELAIITTFLLQLHLLPVYVAIPGNEISKYPHREHRRAVLQ